MSVTCSIFMGYYKLIFLFCLQVAEQIRIANHILTKVVDANKFVAISLWIPASGDAGHC